MFMKKRLLSILAALLLVSILTVMAAADNDVAGVISHEEFLENNEVFASSYEPSVAVQQKVQEVAELCRNEGFTSQYETALWLHDWLTANAYYDNSRTIRDPDGVLIQGTGVCQSYTTAFGLLLDEFEIENTAVISDAINHTWNMVKLDGVWCHIDVTWDDPTDGTANDEVKVSGNENHNYFGMDDTLISRDHSLEVTEHPCSSLQNYYPRRSGGIFCFSTEEELYATLSSLALTETENIEVCYTGTDADFSVLNAIDAWLAAYSGDYGVSRYYRSASDYSGSLTLSYVQSNPIIHLDTPLQAPDFSLGGPDGVFRLANYSNNGLLMIFGAKEDAYTRTLLNRLSGSLDQMNQSGVEVLVSISNAVNPFDLQSLQADFPGFFFCYDESLLWNFMDAVGFQSNNFFYPCVFLINSAGNITGYATGNVSCESLLSETGAVATNQPLPDPEPTAYHLEVPEGDEVSISAVSSASIRSALQSVCEENRRVVFLVDHPQNWQYSSNPGIMQDWENHYDLYHSQGMALVAYFADYDVAAEISRAYPHVIMIPYDGTDQNQCNLELLQAAGMNVYGGYYYQSNFLFDHNGNMLDYTNGSAMRLWDCLVLLDRDEPAEGIVLSGPDTFVPGVPFTVSVTSYTPADRAPVFVWYQDGRPVSTGLAQSCSFTVAENRESTAISVSSLSGEPYGITVVNSQLTTLDLPEDLLIIEDRAFENTVANIIIIPDGVTRIGMRAFAGNQYLMKVSLPASLTDIASDAFADCSSFAFEYR